MPISSIIGIKGTGVYFPRKKVNVEHIAKTYGIDHSRIIKDHGVKEIHVASEHETEFYMATQAVKDALKDAKLSPKNIDLMIYCKGLTVKKSAAPSSSILIDELQAYKAYGFDLDAGFIGGLMGIHIANDIILNNPNINNAIVVASQEFDEIYLFDKSSRVKNMIFGDGAAAVVLSKQGANNSILSSTFIIDNYSGFVESLIRKEFREKSIMKRIMHSFNSLPVVKDIDGNKVMIKAAERWVDNSYRAIDLAVKRINLDFNDINHFIKTQLSLKETEMLAKRLNIDKNKIFNASSEKGHLGQADILSNLHMALKNIKMNNLDIIVLVAANYDCSSGAIVLRR